MGATWLSEHEGPAVASGAASSTRGASQLATEASSTRVSHAPPPSSPSSLQPHAPPPLPPSMLHPQQMMVHNLGVHRLLPSTICPHRFQQGYAHLAPIFPKVFEFRQVQRPRVFKHLLSCGSCGRRLARDCGGAFQPAVQELDRAPEPVATPLSPPSLPLPIALRSPSAELGPV